VKLYTEDGISFLCMSWMNLEEFFSECLLLPLSLPWWRLKFCRNFCYGGLGEYFVKGDHSSQKNEE